MEPQPPIKPGVLARTPEMETTEAEWKRFLAETAVVPVRRHLAVTGGLLLGICAAIAVAVLTPVEKPVPGVTALGVTVVLAVVFIVIMSRRRGKLARRTHMVAAIMTNVTQARSESGLAASLSILADLGRAAQPAVPLLKSVRDAKEASPRVVELCNETLAKIAQGGAVRHHRLFSTRQPFLSPES